MKKFHVALLSAVVALCANVFAVNVGDSASYVRNSDRTSKIIRKATGTLSVIDAPQGMTCDGTVIKMDYYLDVLLKGEQIGDIGICVPNHMLGTTFYADLSKVDSMNFGAFELEHRGISSATDSTGKTYPRCDVIQAIKVDHTATEGQAKVMWINKVKGSIEYVTDLEIGFKAVPSVKVLGAVEIDVKGVSNRGISFSVGLDLM